MTDRGEDLARLSEAVLGGAPAKSSWWKTVVLQDGSEMIVWRAVAPREYNVRTMHRGSTIGTIRAVGRGKRPWRVIVEGYELTSRFPTLQDACEAFAAFHPKYDAVAGALAGEEGSEVPDLFETFERTLFWIMDHYLGGVDVDSVRAEDLGDAMGLWFLKNFNPKTFKFNEIFLLSVVAGGHRIDDLINFPASTRSDGMHPSHRASTLKPGPDLYDPRDVIFDVPDEVHIVWETGSSYLDTVTHVALTVEAERGDTLHQVLRRAWTEDMKKLALAADRDDEEGDAEVRVLPRDEADGSSVHHDARSLLKELPLLVTREGYMTPSLIVVGGRACRTDFARTWIVPSELVS